MKQKKNLHTVILSTTLIPLLALGLVIMLFCYHSFKAALEDQTARDLKNIGYTIIDAFDYMYPGDYDLIGDTAYDLVKGEHILTGEYDYIDRIKENTGMDVTLFYMDTRILTTICDENGNRIIGTGANQNVLQDVLFSDNEAFYTNGVIHGETYFSYYIPLKNSDGNHVGMLSVSEPTTIVHDMIWKGVYPIFVISIGGMIIAGAVAVGQANNLVSLIKKIQSFLSQIAKGNLSASLSPDILKRQDEFGEMGHNAVHMQLSLKELIEHDSLTKLYNRRFTDKYLANAARKAMENKSSFTFAIADIDFFKSINDTYGHEGGDYVLVEIASFFKDCMVPYGFAARWGGEEFLLVFDKCTSKTAGTALEEIRNKVEKHELTYHQKTFHITATIGAVTTPETIDLDELFRQADEKLYTGKQNGRNQVVF